MEVVAHARRTIARSATARKLRRERPMVSCIGYWEPEHQMAAAPEPASVPPSGHGTHALHDCEGFEGYVPGRHGEQASSEHPTPSNTRPKSAALYSNLSFIREKLRFDSRCLPTLSRSAAGWSGCRWTRGQDLPGTPRGARALARKGSRFERMAAPARNKTIPWLVIETIWLSPASRAPWPARCGAPWSG
jgi:hypothetical protein